MESLPVVTPPVKTETASPQATGSCAAPKKLCTKDQPKQETDKKEETVAVCPTRNYLNYLYYFFGGSASLMVMFFVHKRYVKN